MDLQKLNELLDNIESLVQSAGNETIEGENKAFVYTEISNVRKNPTPEQLTIFLNTIADYIYVPESSSADNTITPQTSDGVPVQPADYDVAAESTTISDEDQKKLDALLASLRAMNSSSNDAV